jgi:hypothetical protein
MKPRHAAALALVGWYLMVPPIDRSSGQADVSAPLSEWVVYQPVPSRQNCEAQRAAIPAAVGVFKEKADESIAEKALRQQLLHAQCLELADDDPRTPSDKRPSY